MKYIDAVTMLNMSDSELLCYAEWLKYRKEDLIAECKMCADTFMTLAQERASRQAISPNPFIIDSEDGKKH